MALLPDDFIEQVRLTVDAAEVIGRHVTLRKQGGSLKGLCPFHREKTPSFVVWPETTTWKCFGCGKSGNVFGFVCEKEGATFREAVLQLARQAGISPPSATPEEAKRTGRRTRLLEACEWACRFFEAALRGPDGERARAYFQRREISGETARDFRLGYAPPGWDRLLGAAQRGGFSVPELVDAGLVVHRTDGDREKTYDRFRDRVVFPIADTQGRVIAFGARTLGDDEPKYLNSPETPLFQKGRHLYALHLARAAMQEDREAAVMEGYTDVVLAHQHGYKVAVAGLGTALTERQAALLARHVRLPGRVFLLYDGDAAGQRAAERASAAFLAQDANPRVVTLPPGSDPADIVVGGGLDALRGHLDTSQDAFRFLVRARVAAHGGEGTAALSAAAADVLQVVADVTDPVRSALLVRQLADELGIPEHAVEERLNALRRPARPAAALPAQPAPASDDEVRPPERPPTTLERLLLESALCSTEFLDQITDEDAGLLGHSLVRGLVSALRDGRERGSTGEAVVGGLADPELAALGAALLDQAAGKTDLLRQGRDCLDRLRQRVEARGLHDALREADGGAEEAARLRDLVDFHRRRASGAAGQPLDSEAADRPEGSPDQLPGAPDGNPA